LACQFREKSQIAGIAGEAILVANQLKFTRAKPISKWAKTVALSAINIALFSSLPTYANGVNENGRRAEIVVDVETGKVLHEQNATLLRHPASITKVMTLYLLFEAVESGRLSLDDRITFSRNADRQPATDLGTSAGDSISVETAILALICRSANDVATAVAEHLGGTESAFARQMTQKAQSLGMNDTNFENASGLPNRRQISTAEDIAKLAIAIRRDFPRQYHWFTRESFEYGGRQMNNHNHLVGVVAGVDGLKTGFTSSSGYNLAATATRDGRRIVTVVMGGTNWRERDARVGSLIETAYSNLGINDATHTYASISAYNSYSETDQRDGADIEGLIDNKPAEFRVENVSPINVAFASSGRVIGSMPQPATSTTRMAQSEPIPTLQTVAEIAPQNATPTGDLMNAYASLPQSSEPQENPVAQAVSTAEVNAVATITTAEITQPNTVSDATEPATTVITVASTVSNPEPTVVPADPIGDLLAAITDTPAASQSVTNESTEDAAMQVASFSVPNAGGESATSEVPQEILTMRAEAAEREKQLLAAAIAQEEADRARQEAIRQSQIRLATAAEHERELAAAENARQERAEAVRLERQRQAQIQQARGNVTVQVGAFRARGQAQDLVTRMAHNFPAIARPEVSRVSTEGGVWFRARFTGMAASAARDACRVVIRSGSSCEIIAR